MDKYTINIVNGTALEEILNGTYSVTASSTGYDSSSINPKEITVTENGTVINFSIAATGTLTLHVTDTGLIDGNPIVGATFYRCDSEGTTYGNIVTTNELGNAVFNNVPFDQNNAPTIYYKQIASDGSHNFDDSLQEINLTESTYIKEIINGSAKTKTINLTDANYENLKIDSATINLN